MPRRATTSFPGGIATEDAPRPTAGGKTGMRGRLPDMILGHLPTALAVIDRQARLLYWNTQAAVLWDLPPFLTAEHPPLTQAIARLTMFSAGQQERLIDFCAEHIAQGDHVEPRSWLRIAPNRDWRLSIQVRGMGRGAWLVVLHDSRTDDVLARGPLDPRQPDGSYDVLTMLRNRRHFDEMLAALPAAGDHAVLLIDVDGLETINTMKGRAVGDALLCLIARRLPREMRNDDGLARWQEDEFVVVVPNRAGAEALARRLLRTLSHPFLIEGHSITASFGIGIARWQGSAGLLMQQATTALRVAKQQGPNQFASFDRLSAEIAV